MKTLIAITLLLLLQGCFIGSGENSEIISNAPNVFPQLVGIDLNGDRQELPKKFSKKFNIVIIGFKREQQELINPWIEAFKEIKKSNQEIDFYEMPLIYELGAFSRAWVNNGMRFGILDEEARKRTITVYTNRDQFFKIMQMNVNQIYLLLLDNQGEILLKIEGDFSQEKLKLLSKKLNTNNPS
jgi:hypothetical protein